MSIHVVTEFLQSAAATLAVGRLIWLGLAKRFGALFAYLTLLATSNFVYAVIPQTSLRYFYVYLVAAPMECVLSTLVVGQLFSLIFRDYPGIATVGRWAIYSGIAIAVVASSVIARVFWQGGPGNRAIRLFYLEVGQRSIVFSLAVLIATIFFVLSKYPLQLTRNTWFSSIFFGVLFLSDATRLLIDSLTTRLYNQYVDGAESMIIVCLLIGWACLMGREPSPKISRIHSSAAGETHLMEQLETLNDFLGRAGQRQH